MNEKRFGGERNHTPQSSSWWERKRKVMALGNEEHPTEEAIQQMTEALHDENRYVQLAALKALEQQAPHAHSAIPTLSDMFLDDLPRELELAIHETLTKIGTPTIPYLVSLLINHPNKNHHHITQTLTALGAPAAQYIANTLQENTLSDRAVGSLLSAIAKMGEKAALVAPALVTTWQNKPIQTRSFIYALGKLGKDAAAELAKFLFLVQNIEDERTKLQEEVARKLQELETDAEGALPQIVEALEHHQDFSRSTVNDLLQVICSLGKKATSSVTVLQGMLTQPDQNYHVYSLTEALGSLGVDGLPPLVTILRQHTKEKNPTKEQTNLVFAALYGLQKQGTKAREAYELVLPYLEHNDENLRSQAIETLKEIGATSTEAILALSRRLGQEKNETDRAILRTLEDFGAHAAPALDALRACVESDTNNLREIFAVLYAIGEDSIPTLLDLLTFENKRVALYAAQTLGDLHRGTPEALALICHVLQSPIDDKTSRYDIEHAIHALRHIPFTRDTIEQLRPFFAQPSLRSNVMETLLYADQRMQDIVLPSFFSTLALDEKKQLSKQLEQMAYQRSYTFDNQRGLPHPRLFEPATKAQQLLSQQMEPSASSTNQVAQNTNFVEEEEFVYDGGFAKPPFNPADVRIETRTMTIDLLLERIRLGELELRPSFQRNSVWKTAQKSLLIESLFLRIPLPAFYFDASNDDQWLVVDGQQRLTAIHEFIEGDLTLDVLEFYEEYRGASVHDLPRHLLRKIRETQVTVYAIESGTPTELKFNIFKRINTGGLPLSDQEIRHALYQGPASKLLEELAHSPEFTLATGESISDERMEARELVLRWFAFYMHSHALFHDLQYEQFLNQTMKQLNTSEADERTRLSESFRQAMSLAYTLLGRDAFRRLTSDNERRAPLNKPLFDAWSVNLSLLNEREQDLLFQKRELLVRKWHDLLSHDQRLINSITKFTNKKEHIQNRFSTIKQLIQDTLSDNDVTEEKECSPR